MQVWLKMEDVFSAIHGDLVTELFNKEIKGRCGPFPCMFNTNTDSVNTSFKTIIALTILKVALKQFHFKTSSKHKKLTRSGKELHSSRVKSLKKKLSGYRIYIASDLH